MESEFTIIKPHSVFIIMQLRLSAVQLLRMIGMYRCDCSTTYSVILHLCILIHVAGKDILTLKLNTFDMLILKITNEPVQVITWYPTNVHTYSYRCDYFYIIMFFRCMHVTFNCYNYSLSYKISSDLFKI